jgi:coatomer subunit beta
LDGEFFVGAALAGTLTKVALRYIGLVADQKKQNVRPKKVFHLLLNM